MGGHRVDSLLALPAPGAVTDINHVQVLGVALAAGNPVITGIFDALGNRMPAMDAAVRPGFQDIIDRWARQLGQVDLSRVLGAALTSANPVIAGIFDAAGNRMPSMDIAARPGFQDVIDRAARLLGIVYGNQAQLQQVAGTLELITQDTGLNTNPRRLESDNGFWSAVTAVVGPAATALWTTATTPARTAGLDTTIYTIEIENSTGAAVTAWLEIGGVAITVPFHVANDDSIVIDYVAGFATGDNDVNCNASAVGVNISIKGTEI